MRTLILIAAGLLAFLGIFVWEVKSGQPTPKWLYVLAALPFAWLRIFGTPKKQAGPVAKGIGVLYLLGASIFLMVIGFTGMALRGTWGEILAPALPVGAAVFLLILLAALFRR